MPYIMCLLKTGVKSSQLIVTIKNTCDIFLFIDGFNDLLDVSDVCLYRWNIIMSVRRKNGFVKNSIDCHISTRRFT